MSRYTDFLCLERYVNDESFLSTAEIEAFLASNHHHHQQQPPLPSRTADDVRRAFYKSKQWPRGATIGIAFLDGDEWQREWVKTVLDTTPKPPGIQFAYLEDAAHADIRISFDNGTWSRTDTMRVCSSTIGTDALVVPMEEPTAVLAWLDPPLDAFVSATNGVEYTVPADAPRRPADAPGAIVRHMAMHILGATHSHEPDTRLPANQLKKTILTTVKGMTPQAVDRNIIHRYRHEKVQNVPGGGSGVTRPILPLGFLN
jgi:hypothetical protein